MTKGVSNETPMTKTQFLSTTAPDHCNYERRRNRFTLISIQTLQREAAFVNRNTRYGFVGSGGERVSFLLINPNSIEDWIFQINNKLNRQSSCGARVLCFFLFSPSKRQIFRRLHSSSKELKFKYLLQGYLYNKCIIL